MFGVLIVVFGGDGVAGALRIAGKLEIFLGDVGCRAPNFHVRSIGLVHARQRILVMTTLCGCDPACACSDRFSWFAVPPTPLFAAARMPPSQHFTECHVRSDALTSGNLSCASLSQLTAARAIDHRRPPFVALFMTSRTFSNAALTGGFAAVLRTPRYARRISTHARLNR